MTSINTSNKTNKTEEPNKLNLTVIYGKAGSGKTTQLVDLICKSKDYIVLAPTNAAVENIYNLVCQHKHKTINRDKFKTIYSFFRIDYENDQILGAVYYPSNIFIDEFGLMNKHLFKRCMTFAESGGSINMTICGDALQLNPIYNQKQSISLNKLKRLNHIYDKNDLNYLSPLVVEHLHLSIFGSKRILNKSNNNKLILHTPATSIFFNAVFEQFSPCKTAFCTCTSEINTIKGALIINKFTAKLTSCMLC